MSETVSVEVTRTKADYFEAVMANAVQSRGSLLSLLIPPFIVVAAVLATRDYLPFGERLNQAFGFGALIAGFTLALFAGLILWSSWRSWGSPGALDRIKYTFTDDALAIEAKMGAGESKWAIWKRAFETQNLILIRHQLNMIHILPKRDIDAATQERLKALLRRVLEGRVQFWEKPS